MWYLDLIEHKFQPLVCQFLNNLTLHISHAQHNSCSVLSSLGTGEKVPNLAVNCRSLIVSKLLKILHNF